jgi:urease accessory protein
MNLARLFQLASPALPVGAYSHSGGLEAAVEDGVVSDAASAERWIGDVLEFSMARMEAPILFRMLSDLKAWNETFLASRETAELRAETVQMGYSLNRLLKDLGLGEVPVEEPSFPAAYAFAASAWKIEPEAALQAYLWAWIENQVMAAIKAVPLGQTDGQRILMNLGNRLPSLVEKAVKMKDEDLGNFVPGLALLSSRHETQYSRLFRS